MEKKKMWKIQVHSKENKTRKIKNRGRKKVKKEKGRKKKKEKILMVKKMNI